MNPEKSFNAGINVINQVRPDATSQRAGNPESNQKSAKWTRPAFLKGIDFLGLIRGVMAFGFGALAYMVSKAVLPDNMWDWVRYASALVIALLALWIFDKTQKEKTPFRSAVVIAVFLLFFFNIATRYFILSEASDNRETNHNTVVEQTDNPIRAIMPDTLYPGIHTFSMEAGAMSGPKYIKGSFCAKSDQDNQFKLVFPKSGAVPARTSGSFPHEKDFVIYSLKKQIVTIKIT